MIHDRLEHGAELMYEVDTSVSADRIRSWVKCKGDLAVFKGDASARSSEGPDYSSGEIVGQVNEIINRSK